jgi:hypothetical protein
MSGGSGRLQLGSPAKNSRINKMPKSGDDKNQKNMIEHRL